MRRPVRGERRTPASGLDSTEVREWAKAQGIEVKDRGRVPAALWRHAHMHADVSTFKSLSSFRWML